MQTYSLLQVLVKPGQPQASDIERLTPFFEGQISNKKMYNVCSLYLEWLKIFDVIKKIMVCARLNENIKQTLWMQTDAEEGTLQEKKNLMHCGCPISTLYESSHTLYQISSLPNPTNYLINHPPPPHNMEQSTLSVLKPKVQWFLIFSHCNQFQKLLITDNN